MFLSATEAPAGEKKEFAPHPKGPCKGVCVELVTTNKKTGEPFSKVSQEGDTKNQMILVFQTDKQTETEDGPQYNVHWEWFNIPQSITNENGKLHKFLKDWEVEIKDYPTQEAFAEEVVGRPAHLVFTHVESKKTGKTYGNLTSCTPVENPADAFQAEDYRPYNEPPF